MDKAKQAYAARRDPALFTHPLLIHTFARQLIKIPRRPRSTIRPSSAFQDKKHGLPCCPFRSPPPVPLTLPRSARTAPCCQRFIPPHRKVASPALKQVYDGRPYTRPDPCCSP